MRVLVTGSNGYIGPVMARVLCEAGHDVTGLDTGYFDGCTFAVPSGSIATIQKDVRTVTPADLEGFDAVVHLAALSNDPMGDLDPELTLAINYRASVRLARAAKVAGVRRFLFSSSCSVYGAGGDGAVTEESALAPLTAYARSKVATEQEISRLADADFTPVYLRNATAYGVSPLLRVDLVLNNLVGWAHTTGAIKILSDGTPWRPLVHIEDIARAFAAVLDAPQDAVHDEAFNVGANSENYRVRDLAEIVRETVPGCTVAYAGNGEPDRRSYRVDFSKLAERVPAFRPQWTARRGAEELWQAYRQAGLSAAALESRTYIRLKQLRHLIDTGALNSRLHWSPAAERRAA